MASCLRGRGGLPLLFVSFRTSHHTGLKASGPRGSAWCLQGSAIIASSSSALLVGDPRQEAHVAAVRCRCEFYRSCKVQKPCVFLSAICWLVGVKRFWSVALLCAACSLREAPGALGAPHGWLYIEMLAPGELHSVPPRPLWKQDMEVPPAFQAWIGGA